MVLPILKTWLDLIFVDDNDEIINFKNIPPRFRSHHNLIDVEISLFIPKPPKNDFTYRNFKSITPVIGSLLSLQILFLQMA